jgi:ketosteroid isomerase-like protein
VAEQESGAGVHEADLRDTPRKMSEDSTSPDLVELTRLSLEAGNREDFDAQASIFAPDGVFDASPMGLGIYEGREAIRDFFEETRRPYEEAFAEFEENLDLGGGIGFAVLVLTGRLVSSGELRMRYAGVGVWANGLMQRGTNYLDVEEARAAAERLAQERG